MVIGVGGQVGGGVDGDPPAAVADAHLAVRHGNGDVRARGGSEDDVAAALAHRLVEGEDQIPVCLDTGGAVCRVEAADRRRSGRPDQGDAAATHQVHRRRVGRPRPAVGQRQILAGRPWRVSQLHLGERRGANGTAEPGRQRTALVPAVLQRAAGGASVGSQRDRGFQIGATPGKPVSRSMRRLRGADFGAGAVVAVVVVAQILQHSGLAGQRRRQERPVLTAWPAKLATSLSPQSFSRLLLPVDGLV